MNRIKNIATTAVIIAAIIAGLALLTRNSSESDRQARNTQTAGNQTFDFGRISMAAGKVSHEYEIVNDSGEELKIEKIYTSCMCTEGYLALGGKRFGPFGMPGHAAVPKVNQILSPFEKAKVEAVFDPAAHGPAGIGKISRVVTVETSNGVFEYDFTAEVTP